MVEDLYCGNTPLVNGFPSILIVQDGLQALVDGKVLCVHGGLSPDLRTLDQVQQLGRHSHSHINWAVHKLHNSRGCGLVHLHDQHCTIHGADRWYQACLPKSSIWLPQAPVPPHSARGPSQMVSLSIMHAQLGRGAQKL